jgi:hypothetical protein
MRWSTLGPQLSQKMRVLLKTAFFGMIVLTTVLAGRYLP